MASRTRSLPRERERHVGDTAGDVHARARLLDGGDRVDEAARVVVVLFQAGGHGQHVGIEDDVFGGEIGLVDQQAVGTLADLQTTGDVHGLSSFVEGHHHHRGAVATAGARLVQELFFAFLQADGVDDALALHALEARLDDRPFRAVDHDGQTRDLGLAGQQVQEFRHGLLAVEHGVVHVDVDDVGAATHLGQGDFQGRGVVAGLDQVGELLRARHVGALADEDEIGLGADGQGVQARQAQRPVGLLLAHARGDARHRLGDLADVIRGGAAAAAHDVDEACARQLRHQRRRVHRVLVIAAKGVGQAGVGVTQHALLAGLVGQVLYIGTQLRRAASAVQTHRQRARVSDRRVEGIDGLARHDAAALVGDGAGDHDGHALALVREHLLDGAQASLERQGVEHGFRQQEVAPAIEQATHLFLVGGLHLIEGDGAIPGIADLWAHGECLVGGPECTGHQARPRRILGRDLVGHLAGHPSPFQVQIVDRGFQQVVGLRDAGAVEGVGLENVGPRVQVGAVNVGDDIGAGQDENVVVATQVVSVVGKARSAEVRLGQGAPLDHRAHGAVDDQDAFLQGGE